MKYLYALSILLLALFLAVFIHQNGTEIQLHYFHWSTSFLPISLYMILCFAGGYVLAMVVGFVSGVKFRFRASGAEREARQLRAELEQMKRGELENVAGELAADAEKTASADDFSTRITSRKDDSRTMRDQDSDEETVNSNTGGEEEK